VTDIDFNSFFATDCTSANVTGLTGYSYTCRKTGNNREGKRDTERMRFESAHNESPSLFSIDRCSSVRLPTIVTSSLPPSTHSVGIWVTGLSSPAVARPSPLPEVFPTNCSCERTTMKTKEDPEPREYNSSSASINIEKIADTKISGLPWDWLYRFFRMSRRSVYHASSLFVEFGTNLS